MYDTFEEPYEIPDLMPVEVHDCPLDSSYPAVFAGLLYIDKVLQSKGFPAISHRWLDELYIFYTGGFRAFVARVGRRGGKSQTMCRVAVAEVLYGKYTIPPGDIGVFTIVSVDRADAMERLKTISSILDALGVPYYPLKETLRLKQFPVEIRVKTANPRTIVGHTSIGYLCDELASWRDGDTSKNPAREVLARLNPCTKTQPNAHSFLVSSAWGMDDAHYDAVELGTNARQYVCIGPTWEFNPSPETTEVECRLAEPDELIFLREYGSIPMPAGTAQFFDGRNVDAALKAEKMPYSTDHVYKRVAGLDLGFVQDHSALMIMDIFPGGIYQEYKLLEFAPGKAAISWDEVVQKCGDALVEAGCHAVMADAWGRKTLLSPFGKRGISVRDAPTRPDVHYTQAKKLFAEGKVILTNSKRMRKQLIEVTSSPLQGGRLKINLPRGANGHSDALSALVLALYQKTPGIPPKKEDIIREQWDPQAREMYLRALKRVRRCTHEQQENLFNE